MGAEPRFPIQEAVSSCRIGYALPANFYTSPDVFETDVEVFFHRHWIYVGLEADVPEPGDVFTLEVGRNSLLILRDDDGIVRAFHNVCRHRGARLVDEQRTTVGRLVCPYHQWTYELDGELIHAAHMGAQFDKCAFGLKPVHLRSVGGLLMVCLAEEAPSDIDRMAEVMELRLEPYNLRDAKIACEVDLIEEGNWKLAIDNNRECYHCSGSHPELSNSLNPLDIGFDPSELSATELEDYESYVRQSEAEVSRWEKLGFASSRVEEMTDCATLFRTERFAIAGAGESHTVDTRAACTKLLGSVPDPKFGDLHFWTHNSWSHFLSDHAVTTYILPLSPNRTLVRTRWLVHKDAKEGLDYDPVRLTEVWKATNQQDADLVARTQKGVEGGGYLPGPLSQHTERLVDLNLRWYLSRLAANVSRG